MKIGLRSNNGAEDRLQFAQQIGVDGASIWASACQGYTERCYLTVDNVLEMRERFAKYDLELIGTVPKYREVFPHEGDGDMVEDLKALKEVDYDGYIVPDHHFGLIGDSDWAHCSRAWQVGYIHGLMQALGI